jgi:RNA polymerase sigma-70 factor (ECF subfamily)
MVETVAGLDGCLLRVGLGEAEAFDVLYDRLAPKAYGLVLRIVRDPLHAEDVVQEVMMDVWRTAAKFDPERGSARAWVLTIAHRRAVDRIRMEQSILLRQERAAREFEPLIHEQAVSEVVERRSDEQHLHRCIGGLTPLQRESVELAYFGGMTYQQVAEALDAPLGTVKSRIRDGLGRLRDCLEA